MTDPKDYCRKLCDMRLNGMSFDRMAEAEGMTKGSLYAIYREFSLCNFYGYEPIPKAKLKSELSTYYLSIPDIARLHEVSCRGLINYLTDRDLARVPDDELIKKFVRLGRTKKCIADYYGISVGSVKKLLRNMDKK